MAVVKIGDVKNALPHINTGVVSQLRNEFLTICISNIYDIGQVLTYYYYQYCHYYTSLMALCPGLPR